MYFECSTYRGNPFNHATYRPNFDKIVQNIFSEFAPTLKKGENTTL